MVSSDHITLFQSSTIQFRCSLQNCIRPARKDCCFLFNCRCQADSVRGSSYCPLSNWFTNCNWSFLQCCFRCTNIPFFAYLKHSSVAYSQFFCNSSGRSIIICHFNYLIFNIFLILVLKLFYLTNKYARASETNKLMPFAN